MQHLGDLATRGRGGAALEVLSAGIELPERLHFAAVRRQCRHQLADTEPGREAEELVREMLG